MKKTLYTLFIILAINLGLGLLISLFIEDASLTQKSLYKIGLKLVLISLVVFVIVKSQQKIGWLNNGVWAIPLTLILIVLSYNQLNNTILEQALSISIGEHLAFLASCLLVGLFEELLFRVYVFNQFLNQKSKEHRNSKKSILSAIALTSLLFGIAHITNIFKENYDLLGVISQILLAFILGVLFQAIYIRFNNVILIAGLHGLVNYLGMYKRKLFGIIPENQDLSTLEIVMSFGFIILLFILIIAPISYLLIKPRIQKTTP